MTAFSAGSRSQAWLPDDRLESIWKDATSSSPHGQSRAAVHKNDGITGFASTGLTSNGVRQIDADHYERFRKRIIGSIVYLKLDKQQRLADRRRVLTRDGHLPRREL